MWKIRSARQRGRRRWFFFFCSTADGIRYIHYTRFTISIHNYY